MKTGIASCGIIGHRPEKLPWAGDEDNAQCDILKYTLAGLIHNIAESGTTEFYSGADRGVNCWASEAVLAERRRNRRIKLHCVLPFREADGGAVDYSKRELRRYRDILEQAESVVYVSRENSEGAFRWRNRYMVNHCDMLLFVYNGDTQGGTADALAYARSLGRTILLLSPLGKAITFENMRPIF